MRSTSGNLPFQPFRHRSWCRSGLRALYVFFFVFFCNCLFVERHMERLVNFDIYNGSKHQIKRKGKFLSILPVNIFLIFRSQRFTNDMDTSFHVFIQRFRHKGINLSAKLSGHTSFVQFHRHHSFSESLDLQFFYVYRSSFFYFLFVIVRLNGYGHYVQKDRQFVF